MQRQSKYKLFYAEFVSSLAVDIPIDITANVGEAHLYEDIEKPYVSGNIVILDDFAMRERLHVKGSERINLEFRSTDPTDVAESVVRTFFISKIIDVKRINDRSEMLSIELVEDHFWINSVLTLSKSYTGELDKICEEIITDQLGKKVARTAFTGTAQGTRKLVVPYMRPINAVQWIKQRASTATGSPMYTYSTLYDEEILISDLDGLLTKDPVNLRQPMYYSSSGNSLDVFEDVKRPYIQVLNYRENISQDSLTLYERGGVGSLYSMTDAGTGLSEESHVSIRNVLDDLSSNNVLKSRYLQNIFDEEITIGNQFSDELNSLNTFQVTSGKTYNQYANFHDETDEVFSRLKSRTRIINLALRKDRIEILMDGSPWFESKTTVGSKIRILFLNSNVAGDRANIADQIDYKKSGDYMVQACHHSLIKEKHRVTAQLTKLENLSEEEITG